MFSGTVVENYVPCNLGPYKEVESWFASCFYGGFGYEKSCGFELDCKRYACLIYVVTLVNESTHIRILYIYDKACSKDGHQRHMFYDEIGLRTQITDINLSSTFNTIGRVFVITSRERGSSLWSLVNYASQLCL